MRRLAPIVASLCALVAVAPAALADDICTRAGFATEGSTKLYRFDTTTGATTTTTIAGTMLGRPAVSPDGTKVYVPDAAGTNTLVVARGADGTDTGTRIAVDGEPREVIFSPDGRRAYVRNDGTDSVSIVDALEDRAITTAGFGKPVADIALSPDGSALYVLISDGTNPIEIHVLATAGDGTSSSLLPLTGTVPTRAFHIAAQASSLVLAVSTPTINDRRLATVPTAGGALTLATATVPAAITDLTLAADGRSAYFAWGAQQLFAVALPALTETTTDAAGLLALAVGPTGLVYGAQGTQIGVFSAGGASSGTPLAVEATHVAICPSTATRPGIPSALRLTRGDGAIAVRWTAPADGGAPITAYEVVATPGDASCTATAATGCTVTGLRNGTGYRFKVRARNAVGWGGWSADSDAMQPRRDTSARTLEMAPITVRTTRKATVFTTRVTTAAAGVFAQTVQIKAKRYCAMSRTVAGPGTYVVRCVMKGAGRRLVRLRRTTFTVRTTFTPRIGTLSADRRDVTVPRRR